MISFRYHLVSLIAAFLALALGIVIGTTALNGPITTDLRNQVNSLKNDRGSLAQQVKTLQGQVDGAGQFADQFGAQIVAGALTKQDIVLLSLPGASSTTRDGVEKEITAAGGKVSGSVSLTTSYIDSRRGADITALATGASHPVGLTLTPTSDPGVLGGQTLAYVLLGEGQPTDLNQVLGGFSELHMLSVNGSSVSPSKTVVVIASGALPNGDYGAGMELSLVTALQQAGGHVVVAGDSASATQAGLVAQVRTSGADQHTVATVDNADTAVGQVSTALAVALIETGTSSVLHFGTAKSAQQLFPSPSK